MNDLDGITYKASRISGNKVIPQHCEKTLTFGFPLSSCDICGKTFDSATVLLGGEVDGFDRGAAEKAGSLIADILGRHNEPL